MDDQLGLFDPHTRRTVASTSRDAYEAIQPRLGSRQLEVLRSLRRMGPGGATREEIADDINRPIQSVCGRVHELVALGLVEETEDRRLTKYGHAAKVCRAVG